MPLAVLNVFFLVRFVLGVRLAVASLGLVAAVMGCNMLPNASIADWMLADVARGVRCTLDAFAVVANHTKGRLLVTLAATFA